MMTVYKVDPLRDERWVAFLERHPGASVFHTPGWLEALRRTYGYESHVSTTSAPREDLRNGLVCCRIHSWLTGRRLVSLPFSDHCEPLVGGEEELASLLSSLKSHLHRKEYVELRPRLQVGALAGSEIGRTFCFHLLDLRPSLETLYRNFHKDCVQRKIRRAEREGLTYEEGATETLLSQFYELMVQTRRRQLLPPQPIAWFRNLIVCTGKSLKIRLVYKHNQPVASILTLRYKDTLVYKYGCSDKAFSNLGGMHLLFWRAIQEAKGDGLEKFDLGRSDLDNPGLIDFKDRWGAQRSVLTYYRYGMSALTKASPAGWKVRFAKYAFARLPSFMLVSAGRLLYRHIG